MSLQDYIRIRRTPLVKLSETELLAYTNCFCTKQEARAIINTYNKYVAH